MWLIHALQFYCFTLLRFNDWFSHPNFRGLNPDWIPRAWGWADRSKRPGSTGPQHIWMGLQVISEVVDNSDIPRLWWGVSHLYMDWSPGHETHTNWNAHPSYQSWIFFSTSQAHCKAPGTRNVLVCLAIFSCWLILPLFGMKPDSFFWSMGKPDHALFKAMALFSAEGAKSIKKLYGKVGVWVGSWFPSFHGFLSHTFTKTPWWWVVGCWLQPVTSVIIKNYPPKQIQTQITNKYNTGGGGGQNHQQKGNTTYISGFAVLFFDGMSKERNNTKGHSAICEGMETYKKNTKPFWK